MTGADLTIHFNDLALQIIAGAIAAGLVGRAFRGGGFGILGDLLIGAIGAIAANFVVGYFNLFSLGQYGLVGELVIAVIGAILVVVIVRLLLGRRTAGRRVVETESEV
jgi:uncharacterized membrane protein YeaQ/YmgE (transglycosylase-associated protein family)